MNEVQWIGGGQVTKEQIDFFLGPATHDMIEDELQLKHKVSQDIPTVPIFEDRTNLIYSQIKEEDGEPEVVSSSYNPSSAVEVVSVFTKCRKLLRGLKIGWGKYWNVRRTTFFYSAKKEIYYLVLRK